MTGKSQNQYGCNLCKRSYKTREALLQHKKDSHSVGSVGGSASRGRGRGRGAGIRGRGGRGFSLNPTNLSASSGNSITVSGEDRILSDVVLTSSKSYTRAIMIDASLSPRLRSLSMAYQRIRFLSVSINVTAQVSAMTNGGYIAGFIMDPDDSKVTKSSLQASTGSVVRKWYESANVFMPPTSQLFYTSSGMDPRFRSPARFWLVMDQAPSNQANVVVSVKWRVGLSYPTYDDLKEDHSFFLSGFEFLAKQDNYNLQLRVISTATLVDDTSEAYPAEVRNSTDTYVFFAVNTFNIEYAEGTGDTGTIQCHFVVYSPGDKRTYASSNGRDIITTKWQSNVDTQILVPCGSYLRHHDCKKQGNLMTAGSSIRPSRSSENLSTLLERITSCLERLETSLPRTSSGSSSIVTVEHLEQEL